MIPVLHGVWASGGLAGDFEHIETQTVGAGGAASITFSSIPQTYRHLQIRAEYGTSIATAAAYVRFNGDSGSNYAQHYLHGNGTAASSNNFTSQTAALLTYSTPGGVTTSPGGAVMDILDYTSTSKNKTLRCLTGYDANGSGSIFLLSGLWFATPAAITSIAFTLSSGNYAQFSTFSLYGVKG